MSQDVCLFLCTTSAPMNSGKASSLYNSSSNNNSRNNGNNNKNSHNSNNSSSKGKNIINGNNNSNTIISNNNRPSLYKIIFSVLFVTRREIRKNDVSSNLRMVIASKMT